MAKQEFDRIQPNPEATILAIRSIGYSFESAIADLVDNCIAANASEVNIQIQWDGINTWCSISDNGDGMELKELREAMRVGSNTNVDRSANLNLGKFGMGLKSAGFSQARRISVITKTRDTHIESRVWDLDHMSQVNEWESLVNPSDQASRFAAKNLKSQGTVIFLENLDGDIKALDSNDNGEELHSEILQLLTRMEHHLSRTFGRFLSKEDEFKIFLNGNQVRAWLPYVDLPATQSLPIEKIRFRGFEIICSGYVLPHPDLFNDHELFAEASIPNGLIANQGFYLYRKNRLIVSAIWFEPRHQKEKEYQLARIEVDLPPALDNYWSLTVDKSRAVPPPALERDFRRFAEMVRQKSREVYRSRGVLIERTPVNISNVVSLINIGTRHGEKFAKVNEEHPLIKQLIASDSKALIKTFLLLLEASITRIIQGSHNERPSQQIPGDIPDGVRELAILLFESFAQSGTLSRDQIRHKLLTIEPISTYPNVIEELFGRIDGKVNE